MPAEVKTPVNLHRTGGLHWDYNDADYGPQRRATVGASDPTPRRIFQSPEILAYGIPEDATIKRGTRIAGSSSSSSQFPGLCCLHLLTPLLRTPEVTDAQVEGSGLPWEVGRSLDGVLPGREVPVDSGVGIGEVAPRLILGHPRMLFALGLSSLRQNETHCKRNYGVIETELNICEPSMHQLFPGNLVRRSLTFLFLSRLQPRRHSPVSAGFRTNPWIPNRTAGFQRFLVS